MLKFALISISFLSITNIVSAKKTKHTSMYFSWGYNRDIYSPSNVHFVNPGKYDFTVHQMKATDRPSFSWNDLKRDAHYIIEPTIPQYQYRIGYFLNKQKTKSIEINFDHTKYVSVDNQIARVSGTINGVAIDKDMVLRPDSFLHFEHTNGANFMMINYAQQFALLNKYKFAKNKLMLVAKAGAGIVIPKTDVTLFGTRLDNKFHIAGYVTGVETGLRYFFTKKFYVEYTGKIAFANYVNALTMEGGRANHSFFAFERLGSVGYCFNF